MSIVLKSRNPPRYKPKRNSCTYAPEDIGEHIYTTQTGGNPSPLQENRQVNCDIVIQWNIHNWTTATDSNMNELYDVIWRKKE